jgi:hypothetical protein
MNDIEERLRDAYLAATDTVSPGNIRQLDEQSVVISWPGSKPRPARRWVIPLATAAAALAIIAASALPQFLTAGGPDSGGRVPHLNPLGERFVSAITPNSRRFFIINLATGKKTRVVAPGSGKFFRTAATGDGVTYVVAVTRPGTCGTWLYQFRLNSAGNPSRLTPFDGGFIRANVNQVKLSADRHTFAYLARRCGAAVVNLNVLNLTSGQNRQWSVPHRFFLSPLSLSGDGAKLTFVTEAVNGVSNVLYLLDTSSAPGPIKERSQVLISADEFRDAVDDPQLSLNGRLVYFVTVGGGVANAVEQVRSVDTSTGQLRLIARASGFFSFTADPSVRRAILSDQPDAAQPYAAMVNIRTGKFTMLPSSFYDPGFGDYVW